MINEKIREIQNGLCTAFIDGALRSNLAYKPQFIYNDNKNGQKVFVAIEEELLRCDRFAVRVAFITKGGITPLLQTLQELKRRGIPGRILTTDYLNFSDPAALDTIAGLPNIELRMYQTERKRISYEGIYFSERGRIPFYYWKFKFNPGCTDTKHGVEYEIGFHGIWRDDRFYIKGV